MFEPETYLLDHLPQIEQMIASIGRRNGLDAAAIEEFAAEVKLRLVADDYAILRAYQGRSAIATYLSAVIARLLLDVRNREWGKWRASAEAARLGAVAVALEQKLYRDGRTLDDAFIELAREHPGLTRAEIDAFAARLPQRVRRRMFDLGAATDVAVCEDGESVARAQMAKKVSRALRARIQTLSPDDQLLLRLRFDSEMSVAQISRSLHKDQHALYRRLYKLFRKLKDDLAQAGITAREVADLIGDDSVVLDFHLAGGNKESS